MDPFEQIANAKVMSGSTQKFKPGTYLAEVYATKCKPWQANPAVMNYVFEYKILQSTNPEIAEGMIVGKVEQTKSKGWDGRVLKALRGITGKADLTRVQVANSFSEENPLAGSKVKIVATASNMKDKSGDPYVDLDYFVVAD